MSNIRLNIERYKTGKNKQPLEEQKALTIAHRLNALISRLIEADDPVNPREFDLWRGMTAGSTAQGSWQNKKGDIAEELVRNFIKRRIQNRHLCQQESEDTNTQLLKDGRTIEYSSEPDIAVYDANHQILAAVEIKGGIDPAGVLERVGAAIKSLSRAKQENEASQTILILYKTSMTYQTIQELEAHQNAIDHWFTIEDVLNQSKTRQALFELLEI